MARLEIMEGVELFWVGKASRLKLVLQKSKLVLFRLTFSPICSIREVGGSHRESLLLFLRNMSVSVGVLSLVFSRALERHCCLCFCFGMCGFVVQWYARHRAQGSRPPCFAVCAKCGEKSIWRCDLLKPITPHMDILSFPDEGVSIRGGVLCVRAYGNFNHETNERI
jgi:hypothetical protein